LDVKLVIFGIGRIGITFIIMCKNLVLFYNID